MYVTEFFTVKLCISLKDILTILLVYVTLFGEVLNLNEACLEYADFKVLGL